MQRQKLLTKFFPSQGGRTAGNSTEAIDIGETKERCFLGCLNSENCSTLRALRDMYGRLRSYSKHPMSASFERSGQGAFQQETDHSIWKTLSNEFPVVERCEMWKIMDEAIGILLGRVWGTTYDAAS